MRVELMLNRNCDRIIHEDVIEEFIEEGIYVVETFEAPTRHLYPVSGVSYIKVSYGDND